MGQSSVGPLLPSSDSQPNVPHALSKSLRALSLSTWTVAGWKTTRRIAGSWRKIAVVGSWKTIAGSQHSVERWSSAGIQKPSAGMRIVEMKKRIVARTVAS